MTNPNLIQFGTHTRGLSVMIGRFFLDSQNGRARSSLRMLAVKISGTQAPTKANTQLRNSNGN